MLQGAGCPTFHTEALYRVMEEGEDEDSEEVLVDDEYAEVIEEFKNFEN